MRVNFKERINSKWQAKIVEKSIGQQCFNLTTVLWELVNNFQISKLLLSIMEDWKYYYTKLKKCSSLSYFLKLSKVTLNNELVIYSKNAYLIE